MCSERESVVAAAWELSAVWRALFRKATPSLVCVCVCVCVLQDSPFILQPST